MGSASVQGALWGASAEEWASLQEPTGTPLYESTFDAIGLTQGTRLLDAGCGAGLALQLAAKRGALVAGLDASPGFLAVARSRVPDADVREGDLEALPYDDGCFDAVTAFNSVQYATDPIAALREIKRVAVVGAPVAVASWGDPERCETRLLLAALGGLLPPPPPLAGGGPFALASPGALEALVERAQLSAQRALEVSAPFDYVDLDAALRAGLSSGPAQAAIRRVGLAAVVDAMTPVLAEFIQSDGSVCMENVFRVVIAQA